jgi:hypothetical protein
MTEDRDIASQTTTSTVKPVCAEMTGVAAVYRYQCEPVSGLTATGRSLLKGMEPEPAPLNLLSETCWASN